MCSLMKAISRGIRKCCKVGGRRRVYTPGDLTAGKGAVKLKRIRHRGPAGQVVHIAVVVAVVVERHGYQCPDLSH